MAYFKKNPRIVCAAIKHKKTGMIIAGPRHFDLIMVKMIEASKTKGTWTDADQGFIDQYGEFWNRQDAYAIAVRNGQYNGDHRNEMLFSEDLY